jgi:hypothetical protein
MMNKLHKFTHLILKDNPPKKDLASAFVWYHFVTTGKEITCEEVNNHTTGHF